MKKLLLLVALASFVVGSSFGAVIAEWTFETSLPSSGTNLLTSLSGITPEIGSGSASGVHATAAAWTSPAGNGSAHSFSVNNWTVGDYFQFQVSTLGQTGIGISYDQTSSGTGPGRFGLAYSLNGISFTPITLSYTVLGNGTAPNPAWNSTTPSSSYSFVYDLSSISAIDNAAAVFFRLVDANTTSASGGTVGAGGTDRIDNFTVASPIPEPSTLALGIIGGMIGFAVIRRRS